MRLDETTDPDSLSERLECLANEVRDQFLADLREGRHPLIEDFVNDQATVARPIVLRALLVAELAWHREQGLAPDLTDLLSRFPDEAPLIDEVFDGNGPTATMPRLTPLDEVVEGNPVQGPLVGQPTGTAGRYEVIRRHAKGGLGVVSLARDLELHRDVAIKEIRPDSADNDQYRARFLREAEVTARLEHPGIVPVYGIGYHEDGRPYYIMRFIRGETLKNAIQRLHNIKSKTPTVEPVDDSKKITFTLPTLVGRLIDACHALAYAHYRKVIHRDVKPDNIMLGPFGETLVVDWGLAKTIDDPDSEEHPEEGTLRPEFDSQVTPTRVGSKLGTVGYMSPEQAAGALAELRPTSDVYSLGVTLYYLITGRTPFEGCGPEEFLLRGRKEEYRKPSEVNPSVPRALEAICLKAMSLLPGDRYATAETLAEDLERWRAGEPVNAYPEPPLDRLARWSRKRRTGLVAVAVLLVSSSIGLAIFAIQERSKNERISQEVTIAKNAEASERHAKEVAKDRTADAIEGRAAAERNLELTRQSLRQLMDGLSEPSLAYLANSGGPRLAMAGVVLEFYQELIRKNADDPNVKFELALASRSTANIARSVGSYPEAEKLYVQSIDFLSTLLHESANSDDYRIELARTTVDYGVNFQMSGRPRPADAKQLQALDILAGRPAGSPEKYDDQYQRTEALASLDLCSARLEMSRATEAKISVERALSILKQLCDRPKPQLFDQIMYVYSLTNRSIAWGEVDNYDEARGDFDEAEKIVRELLDTQAKDNPDLLFAEALITSRRGRLMSLEDKTAESLKLFEVAQKQFIGIYQNNFRPIFLERELAVGWRNRAEARLELLGPKPTMAQIQEIQKDVSRADETLVQLVKNWPDHHDYHALHAQNLRTFARIARINNDDAQANQRFSDAIDQINLACQLNPDDRRYQKLKEKLIEELKTIETNQTKVETHP